MAYTRQQCQQNKKRTEERHEYLDERIQRKPTGKYYLVLTLFKPSNEKRV
jgi:hypothetical protein